jgi:hypothetical protein
MRLLCGCCDVNPFTFDVEKALVERNIAYRVWKRRKTAAYRTRYKELRRQVNYLMRKSKKRFLDPNLPAKKLWRNLDSVGMKETFEDNIIYTPNQLNTFFATPHQTIRPSNTDFDSANDSNRRICLHQHF